MLADTSPHLSIVVLLKDDHHLVQSLGITSVHTLSVHPNRSLSDGKSGQLHYGTDLIGCTTLDTRCLSADAVSPGTELGLPFTASHRLFWNVPCTSSMDCSFIVPAFMSFAESLLSLVWLTAKWRGQ